MYYITNGSKFSANYTAFKTSLIHSSRQVFNIYGRILSVYLKSIIIRKFLFLRKYQMWRIVIWEIIFEADHKSRSVTHEKRMRLFNIGHEQPKVFANLHNHLANAVYNNSYKIFERVRVVTSKVGLRNLVACLTIGYGKFVNKSRTRPLSNNKTNFFSK